MVAADLERVISIAEGLQHAPRWPLAAYQAALDPAGTPKRIALVAEDAEGRTMGFAVASVLPPQSELETIAVAAEAQRRGLAGLLLDALKENLWAAQATEILLEVRVSNAAALGLYRGRGFEECGRRPGYYADPVEDALLLVLRRK